MYVNVWLLAAAAAAAAAVVVSVRVCSTVTTRYPKKRRIWLPQLTGSDPKCNCPVQYDKRKG